MKITVDVEGCNSEVSLVTETWGFMQRFLRKLFPKIPARAWMADGMSFTRQNDEHWTVSYDTAKSEEVFKARG